VAVAGGSKVPKIMEFYLFYMIFTKSEFINLERLSAYLCGGMNFEP
jgi:hypothetical protein